MLIHKMSLWFGPGHDEELARKEALEQWLREVDQRGYMPYEDKDPRVHLIRDNHIPVSGSAYLGKKARGFRVAIQGYMLPKLV